MVYKIVKKVWGSEKWIVNNEHYCGKMMILNTGWRCSLHYHKIKHETFYILEGEVLMEYDGQSVIMKPGDAQTIEPGKKHRFTGLKWSVIMEFSTTHDDLDVYRDEESGFVGCGLWNIATSNELDNC
jgi:mannose-6-phosphate isomerase-like protein (cupin superfamily)